MTDVVAYVVNLDACVAFETVAGRDWQDDAQMTRVYLERFTRSHLKSAAQLANHWRTTVFEDNSVPMSELIVLL